MTVIDDRGRLFGRINLVDGAVAAFALLLIPLAYGTFLLFRPAVPRIDSVSPSIITKEERRIAIGGRLTAKFKIRGTGFTPLLRARIGDAEALGLVFENPNSADLLVGPVPPGSHDLVLTDGVQEVARLPGAITVQSEVASYVRAVGWLTDLDLELVKALRLGLVFPESVPAIEILALGPLRPGRTDVKLAGSNILRPADGLQERKAVLTIRCDPAWDDPCTLGERPENLQPPVVLSLPGPSRYFHFVLEELLPPTPPREATIRVRLPGGALTAMVRAGDRDDFLDARAAVVTAIAHGQGGATMTLNVGLDESRGGWRYRSQRVKPGAPFVFATDQYELTGTIEAVTLPTVPARAAQ